MKLKELEIKSFRGATQSVKIDFDPMKNTTMIFGENGNGKSTISDALICLLSDEIGSIEDRSTVKGSDYLVSSECHMKDVLIKLTTDSGVFAADFSGGGKSWVKKPAGGHPTVRQLRRSHITRLIDSQPAKRYDELRAYIDVSKIETAEAALRNLEKSLEESLKGEVKVITSAESDLREEWLTEGKPNTDHRAWALAEKSKDLKVEIEKRNKLEAIVVSWERLQDAADDVTMRGGELENADSDLLKAVNDLDAQSTDSRTNQESLVSLLLQAKHFLSSETGHHECPVCTQSIEQNVLVGSIEDRLALMGKVNDLINEKESKQYVVDKAKTLFESSQKKFEVAIQAFSKVVLDNANNLSEAVVESAQELSSCTPAYALATYNDLSPILNKLFDKVAAQLQTIDRAVSQYNLLVNRYDSLLKSEARANTLDNLLQKAKQALKLVMEKRKTFIERELNSIGDEIDRLYEQLHPAETLGGVKLKLKPNVRASLELSANFHNQTDINPQSLYSESHLDTLGICIFLALAQKYNDGNTILILDDVVMSVDHSHLDRFIDLIKEESKKFTHVLLTTHYRPWKDRYKHHRAGSGTMHFIELKPWTLKNGISLQSPKMDYSELQEAISNPDFDRQVVAGKAGIFLENMLDFLTLKYRCKLPHVTDPKYTLGDYLSGFGKKLLPAMGVEHLVKDADTGDYSYESTIAKTPLKEVIEELRSIAFIRNEVGAHFNLDSEVDDGEVLNLGKLTLRLAELLICPESGSLPIRSNSGSYHDTSTGSIRLHPFVEPS